jgi:hypothetical protein
VIGFPVPGLLRSGVQRGTCFTLAPILATARRARRHCARRWRTMTILPESRRHEWCLSARGGCPQTARTCSGPSELRTWPREMSRASRLQIRRRVAPSTPSSAIRGCKPVPASARAFHGRRVETAETLQIFIARGRPNPRDFIFRGHPNPRDRCCSRAEGDEGLARGPANRGPCREPHRLFDRTGCISVLRTRLRRSIDSPLPSPPASASLTRQPVRSDR